MADLVEKMRATAYNGRADTLNVKGALLMDAAGEIERLRCVLNDIEFLTATGEGLAPDETMTVHLLAAEGRAYDPAAWRFDPRAVKHVHDLVQKNVNSIIKD